MIREADFRDKEALEQLYRMLSPSAKVLPEQIEAIRQAPYQFLFVYEADGKVAGTIMLIIGLSPMFGTQPFGLLEYLVVDEAHRKQGIGRQLVEFVIRLCREKQCTRLILLSGADRQDAHRFYERLGFDGSTKKGFINYLNRAASYKEKKNP